MEQKTVFLSYRRSTSSDFARSIYQDLKGNGYDCFFDVTSIDSGDFDLIILNQIAARAHFLLVIAPGSLERCKDPGDWVRREIEEAVRLDRNIVPVLDEGVNFTQEMGWLPADLRAAVSRKTGVPLPHFYFEDGMAKIRNRFLKTPVYISVTPTPAADRAEVARRVAAADAPAAPNIVTPYTAELTVDARGSGGAFTTIKAALKRAPDGARITILPGTYIESIVLNKPVTLEGRGGADKVIVMTDDGSCLTMHTDEATVAGLGLRCRAGSRGKKVYGVDIPRGRLILRECDIASDSLSCVGIYGAGARPYLVGCTVRDGKQGGVVVYDQGAGVIEDCQIFGNAYSGIQIKTGGNPTVRGCTVRDGKQGGVFVVDQGAGVIEDCQIFGNANAGIQIQTGGNPTVRGCTVRDGKQGGVFVHEQGAGVIEDCQIYGNAYAGIAIQTGGNPTVRGCTITKNLYEAVWVNEGGRGTIERCDVRGNTRGAWDIDSTSSVTRRDNIES